MKRPPVFSTIDSEKRISAVLVPSANEDPDRELDFLQWLIEQAQSNRERADLGTGSSLKSFS